MRSNSQSKKIFVLAAQPGAESFLLPVLIRAQNLGCSVFGVRIGYDVSGHQEQSVTFAAISSVDDLQIALEDVKPDIILSSISYQSVESYALRWGLDNSTPVIQILDSWYDYRRRVVYTNGEGNLPDRLLVIDEFAREEAMSEGVPDHIISVVGHPAFEHRPQFGPALPRSVLLIDQPLLADGVMPHGFSEVDYYMQVEKSINMMVSESHYKVFVACHPRRSRNIECIPNDWVQMRGDNKLLFSPDFVVGMFSSFMIDAFISGLKVTCFMPFNLAMEKSILAKRGLVPVISDPVRLDELSWETTGDRQSFLSGFERSTERVFAEIAQFFWRRK